MGRAVVFLVAAAAALAVGSPLAAELLEDFDGPRLDHGVWNTCQADERLLAFADYAEPRHRRTALGIRIDERRGNVDICMGKAAIAAPGAADSELGPPTVRLGERLFAGPAKDCFRGGATQRNELRLQNRPNLIHGLREPHWYSIDFRIDGDIARCGSARWILAQWKAPGEDSPFLAQRFDNGILHVTVENNHCRCMVAKGSGDPDAMVAGMPGIFVPLPQGLRETRPLGCIATNPGDDAPETLCEPDGLVVETRGGRVPPALPDPKRSWVRMTYLVKGDGEGNGRIDIYANGEFVVRARGHMGRRGEAGAVKFKIGHYRDRIPGEAVLSVDRFCMSPDVGTCAPGLREVE